MHSGIEKTAASHFQHAATKPCTNESNKKLWGFSLYQSYINSEDLQPNQKGKSADFSNRIFAQPPDGTFVAWSFESDGTCCTSSPKSSWRNPKFHRHSLCDVFVKLVSKITQDHHCFQNFLPHLLCRAPDSAHLNAATILNVRTLHRMCCPGACYVGSSSLSSTEITTLGLSELVVLSKISSDSEHCKMELH